jgi:hypothetical protein
MEIEVYVAGNKSTDLSDNVAHVNRQYFYSTRSKCHVDSLS